MVCRRLRCLGVVAERVVSTLKENLPYISGYPGGLTVLMSVYAGDTSALFKLAVESVYSNTVQPDDFLLVVDGPVPVELDAVIADLKERYPLRIKRLQKNGGLRNALNCGLALIETTWVARADADDINLPKRFECLLAAIRLYGGNLDLIGSAIREVDYDMQTIAERKLPAGQKEIIQFAARRNPFNHMTVVYRLSLAKQCGGYPDLYLKEDYGLWAKMLSAGARVRNLETVLVNATTGKDFYRRRGGWKSALAELRLQRLLVETGLKPKWLAVADFLMRSAVLLSPPAIRRVVYLKMLRS